MLVLSQYQGPREKPGAQFPDVMETLRCEAALMERLRCPAIACHGWIPVAQLLKGAA